MGGFRFESSLAPRPWPDSVARVASRVGFGLSIALLVLMAVGSAALAVVSFVPSLSPDLSEGERALMAQLEALQGSPSEVLPEISAILGPGLAVVEPPSETRFRSSAALIRLEPFMLEGGSGYEYHQVMALQVGGTTRQPLDRVASYFADRFEQRDTARKYRTTIRGTGPVGTQSSVSLSEVGQHTGFQYTWLFSLEEQGSYSTVVPRFGSWIEHPNPLDPGWELHKLDVEPRPDGMIQLVSRSVSVGSDTLPDAVSVKILRVQADLDWFRIALTIACGFLAVALAIRRRKLSCP